MIIIGEQEPADRVRTALSRITLPLEGTGCVEPAIAIPTEAPTPPLPASTAVGDRRPSVLVVSVSDTEWTRTSVRPSRRVARCAWVAVGGVCCSRVPWFIREGA